MNYELMRTTDTACGELGTHSPREQVQQAIQFRDALKEACRTITDKIEKAAMDWIEANGDFSIGTTRYYVGPNKTTKCKSLPSTLRAVLKAVNGDVDEVCRALSASAFKHGACREILPADEYEVLFETREVTDLKTGVAKGDKLQEFDTQWQR